MVLHLWLRAGNTVSASRAVDFIRETLNNKPQWLNISDVRADSGFFSGKIFDFLEELSIPYTIVARATSVVRESVMGITDWTETLSGIEIGETLYRAQEWKKARRVVAVRQLLVERPHGTGQTVSRMPRIPLSDVCDHETRQRAGRVAALQQASDMKTE